MRCDECNQRELCMVLCDDAEVYVSQDEVSQRELTIGIPLYNRMKWSEPTYLTPREHQIVMLLEYGFSKEEIVRARGITRNNLRKILSNVKKKSLRKNYK